MNLPPHLLMNQNLGNMPYANNINIQYNPIQNNHTSHTIQNGYQPQQVYPNMNLPPHLNFQPQPPQIQFSQNNNLEENKSTKKKEKKKVPAVKEKKKLKNVRKAGGEMWCDPTLDEWPENDFRMFCGDLGNEVTDEILANAFRKYPSFQKARVLRDKRTGKTKGYGFISFKDSEDFLKAMREMNGKYVGNRPIRLKRSNWKDRNVETSKSKLEHVKFKKNKQKIRKNIMSSQANNNNFSSSLHTSNINQNQNLGGYQYYQ